MARQIEPKMTAWLDAKLKDNGLAQAALAKKDARTLMLKAAEVCVGIREATGHNDGPMVELIQETIGGHNHEAWCMAFVETCVAYAEVKTGVKSKLPATEHCMTLFREVAPEQRVKYFPAPGAIVIWRHGSTDSGHTGFFLAGLDDGGMQAVEGNTEKGLSPNGSVVREGGGVYFTERSMHANGDMKVQGFIKPF